MMLEETVKDYCPYIKLDISKEIGGVQSVVDNMLTRLEEFESVLNMIKLKNNDCASSTETDIETYRAEITTLSKKIDSLEEVVSIVKGNVDILEQHIERAESDFGVSSDNKLKMFFKPFLTRSKEANPSSNLLPVDPIHLESVLGYFEEK